MAVVSVGDKVCKKSCEAYAARWFTRVQEASE